MENNMIEKIKSCKNDNDLRKIIKSYGKERKLIPGLVYQDLKLNRK